MSYSLSNSIELWRAIEDQDIETTRQLIPTSNVNTPNEEGNTALHLVIMNFDDLNIITLVLNERAYIRAVNHNNNTPLDVAILNNKTEAALLLIEREALLGENITSLLLMAIDQNNETVAKELVEYGVQSNPSMNLSTPLSAAIFHGNLKIMESILPYCQLWEPYDKYIPNKAVISSDTRYKECVELLLQLNFTNSPNSHKDRDFIFAAVEKGYLPIVLQLLELKIDVNMVDSNTGLNLLTVACLHGHHEIVENLLEHDAVVDTKIPAKNWTLVKRSCFYFSIRSFNELFRPSHQDQLGDITCLHIAVVNSDSKMLEVLLKYNPTIDNLMAFKLTCIAAHHGCEDIVRSFLDRGVDVTDTDSEGRSLLHYCIHLNSTSGSNDSRYNIAQLLLEKAANINNQNPDNKFVFEKVPTKDHKIPPIFWRSMEELHFSSFDDTLLHKAILNKFDTRFIATLLNNQFSVHAKNCCGMTPLHFACKVKSKNQLENIEILLQHNANINCTSHVWKTPLHIVSRDQNLEVMALLLEKGANSNAKDRAGRTPLHIVCENTLSDIHQEDNTEGLLQLLLRHNANIETVNITGLTPLSTAYLYGNEVAIKCLLENHAKENCIYSENSGPLFWAVDHERIEVIKSLLKYGSDINALDERNRTALYKQLQHDYSYYYDEIVKLLKTQVVKLKVAGLNVIRQNLNLVYNSDDNEDHFIIDVPELEVKCQQEIERMKMKSIGHDNMTLYDLLKKSITILSRLDGNEEIQEALEQEDYDQEFPLYIDIVRSKVREAKFRYTLMNSARKCFSVNVCRHLPYECMDLILSYLKCKELKMFIEAMMPPKN